jgi:hypothetical protein
MDLQCSKDSIDAACFADQQRMPEALQDKQTQE